jgi:hypothetical protein
VTEKGETLLQLTERATGKEIGRSNVCGERFAMTFDAGGTRLAIGGTRSVCIVQIPSLRLVASTTLDVGSGDSAGRDRVSPEYVNDGRLIFAGRRDGLAALLDASSLKRTWTGQGRLVRLGGRAAIEIGSTVIGDIGPSGRVTTREASVDELVQASGSWPGTAPRPDAVTARRLEGLFCALDVWLLPLPCP